MMPTMRDPRDQLGITIVGTGTETPYEAPFTITGRRPVAQPDANGETQDFPAGATLRVGAWYDRTLETVQFVKRTQTGTSGRVRPARILDVVVDYVLQDPDAPRPRSSSTCARCR